MLIIRYLTCLLERWKQIQQKYSSITTGIIFFTFLSSKANFLYFYKKLAMYTSIYFPVKPHVFKYLVYRFGESFTYANNSTLAPIIKSTICTTTKSNTKIFISDFKYQVNLTEYYFNKFNVVFSRAKLYDFNLDVDRLFREELFQFMILSKNIYNHSYKSTLKDFLEKLNITENDIKLETLLKDFTRKSAENDSVILTPKT